VLCAKEDVMGYQMRKSARALAEEAHSGAKCAINHTLLLQMELI
jgi:hypothetical protein